MSQMQTSWSEKQIEETAKKYPKTRRELLSYLWFAKGLYGSDIYKCGPEYTACTGRRSMATRLRTIDAITFGEWEKRIREKYFPL